MKPNFGVFSGLVLALTLFSGSGSYLSAHLQLCTDRLKCVLNNKLGKIMQTAYMINITNLITS